MPELALALWALYYAVALGVRVGIHLRRTGSTGLVGMRGWSTSAQMVAELLELAALALGLAAPILALSDTVEPIDELNSTGSNLAGAGVFLAGLGLIVASQHAMGRSWRIGVDRSERTELVTDGPFAHARNPIFTALVVVLLGVFLMVPSVVAAVAVAVMVLSVELQARVVEEPYLRRAHGDEYARYAERVGRFVPSVGRLGQP